MKIPEKPLGWVQTRLITQVTLLNIQRRHWHEFFKVLNEETCHKSARENSLGYQLMKKGNKWRLTQEGVHGWRLHYYLILVFQCSSSLNNIRHPFMIITNSSDYAAIHKQTIHRHMIRSMRWSYDNIINIQCSLLSVTVGYYCSVFIREVAEICGRFIDAPGGSNLGLWR